MSAKLSDERTDSDAALPRWRFAHAQFDERTLELLIGGQPVEAERKPLEVLRHLLRHAGEVVTKSELEEAVWPGRILSDTVLKKCVSRLRDFLQDQDEAIIKTVRGYGYRLVAAVEIEQPRTATAPPRFDFKPGDAPPQRPQWKFVERLDTGGHGEAWLTEHDKTRERRVYKFAFAENVLVALKREITLYRLLHDVLGERPDFVRLLDWNLAEPPYFTEAEYAQGGNLLVWAGRQGGLSQVPLETRLDLAAQAAETLAAAHSVGVLHKDLKPSNVLIQDRAGAPRIQLADFGSGGVLNPDRLDELGITRLGFTRMQEPEMAAGTLMYMSPEALAGQPATVQADVYSLGMLLYQLVVADFKRPLAAGWEQDVQDELLREDIAEAAHGDPRKRLADALSLARRLRDLPQRRRHREEQEAARRDADAAARALERLKAKRAGYLTAIGVLLVGLASTLFLYSQRQQALSRARSEAEASRQITDYVISLFDAAAPDSTGGKPIEARKLVDQGKAQLAGQLKDQPLLRARMLGTVGALYCKIGIPAECRALAEEALAVQHAAPGADPLVTAQLQHALAKADMTDARWLEAEKGLRAVLATEQARLPGDDPRIAGTLTDLGATLLGEMKVSEAIPVLEHARELRREPDGSEGIASLPVLGALTNTYYFGGKIEQADALIGVRLRVIHATLGDYSPQYYDALRDRVDILNTAEHKREALAVERQVLAGYLRIYGDNSQQVNDTRTNVAALLRMVGEPRESAEIGAQALDGYRKAKGSNSPEYAWALRQQAANLRYLGQYAEAVREFREAYGILRSADPGSRETQVTRIKLGEALIPLGNTQEALALLQPEFPAAVDLKNGYFQFWREQWLGDCHAAMGQAEQAEQAYQRADAGYTATGFDQFRARLPRLQLLLRQKRYDEALPPLRKLVADGEQLFGAESAYTVEAQAALAEALAGSGRTEEARTLVERLLPLARRELAPTHLSRLALEQLLPQLAARPTTRSSARSSASTTSSCRAG